MHRSRYIAAGLQDVDKGSGREVGRQTQNALMPHLASAWLCLTGIVLGAGTKPEARFDDRQESFKKAILYANNRLNARELWTLRPSRDVRPDRVGLLA